MGVFGAETETLLVLYAICVALICLSIMVRSSAFHGTRRQKRQPGKKKGVAEPLLDLEAQGPSDGELGSGSVQYCLSCPHVLTWNRPADGEDGEEDDEDDLHAVFIDDTTDEAAQIEAAQLLQGLRTYAQVADASFQQAAAPAEPAAAAPPAPRKRGRPAGSKNKPTNPAEWEAKEVSVTITAGCTDIDASKLDDMDAFLSKYCLAGMFSLERGGTVCHLHLQGFVRMRAKTVRGITIAIKQHLQWDNGKQPFGSRVMCRGLTEHKLHTWVGLLGYCCKDMHEQHFQVCTL